jgi:hypothetical protein
MAQVFRNHDSAQERAILFKGLNPNADYQIEFVDAATQFRADGSRLMSQGLIVSLPKPFSSEILRLARVSDGS